MTDELPELLFSNIPYPDFDLLGLVGAKKNQFGLQSLNDGDLSREDHPLPDQVLANHSAHSTVQEELGDGAAVGENELDVDEISGLGHQGGHW